MKSDDEVIMVQGRHYEPTEFIGGTDNDEFKPENLVVGSNPEGKFVPDAYHKCIDELIASEQLHTKSGILIGKRKGKDYYDVQGNLIKER